ncbi:MAG: hypothetical protein IBX64_12205 [Actinobacteria bacterium]|nr:hypothetical protein [Actinomycetota bacterium]
MSESVTIALIGVGGAVIGSIATLAGNFLMHWLKNRDEKNKEKPARELLTEMLSHNGYTWRKLDTLMHVIGANEETTKRLLLEVGARASEDGQNLWALKSRAPLNTGK